MPELGTSSGPHLQPISAFPEVRAARRRISSQPKRTFDAFLCLNGNASKWSALSTRTARPKRRHLAHHAKPPARRGGCHTPSIESHRCHSTTRQAATTARRQLSQGRYPHAISRSSHRGTERHLRSPDREAAHPERPHQARCARIGRVQAVRRHTDRADGARFQWHADLLRALRYFEVHGLCASRICPLEGIHRLDLGPLGCARREIPR